MVLIPRIWGEWLVMVPQKLRGETPSTQELDLRLQRRKAAELMLISLNGSKTLEKKNQKLETGTSCAAWMWRQRCMVLLRIISKQEEIFLLTFPLFFPHLEELIKEPAVKKKCGLPSHRLNFIEQSIKTVCLK